MHSIVAVAPGVRPSRVMFSPNTKWPVTTGGIPKVDLKEWAVNVRLRGANRVADTRSFAAIEGETEVLSRNGRAIP